MSDKGKKVMSEESERQLAECIRKNGDEMAGMLRAIFKKDKKDLFEEDKTTHLSFPCIACKHRIGPIEYCQRCIHFA